MFKPIGSAAKSNTKQKVNPVFFLKKNLNFSYCQNEILKLLKSDLENANSVDEKKQVLRALSAVLSAVFHLSVKEIDFIATNLLLKVSLVESIRCCVLIDRCVCFR